MMRSLSLLLAATQLSSIFNFVAAYVGLRNPSLRSDTRLFNNAASALIRKAKMKEVDVLKQQIEAEGNSSPVKKFLAAGKFTDSYGDVPAFIPSVLNRYQSVTVMPEYSKKVKTGFILGIPEPEIMSGVLRDAGSRAIVVCLDKRVGGASYDEFSRFVLDQSRSKKLLPSSIPIVWNDHIVDNIQIAHAGSLGASAITLNPDCTDDLKGQVDYCNKLHIEPIVLAKNLDEAEHAISCGTKIVCMHLMDESEFISVRKSLPSDKGIIYMARFRAESEFSGYAEIDLAWSLRDNGYNVVWPSPEAVYATGFVDLYATILALKSKSSRQFLSPRQFMMERKKEGATEFLGDILY